MIRVLPNNFSFTSQCNSGSISEDQITVLSLDSLASPTTLKLKIATFSAVECPEENYLTEGGEVPNLIQSQGPAHLVQGSLLFQW